MRFTDCCSWCLGVILIPKSSKSVSSGILEGETRGGVLVTLGVATWVIKGEFKRVGIEVVRGVGMEVSRIIGTSIEGFLVGLVKGANLSHGRKVWQGCYLVNLERSREIITFDWKRVNCNTCGLCWNDRRLNSSGLWRLDLCSGDCSEGVQGDYREFGHHSLRIDFLGIILLPIF
ncbi:hypothetical protein L6452_18464 [Arctium lappa]|uniref:Uncharacterized protein n=1 Tax=Arctium lappa TaxID=4217 RepID=A0ACB9C651_ARCLA|nr:hypothetical protein L6452_18464 [Arctium lappa]